MRFDIEPIPVSTPPLEGSTLDPMGVPEDVKSKERMTSRGWTQKAKPPGLGPSPMPDCPPAIAIPIPVFGTPKAGSVTQRIKHPKVIHGLVPQASLTRGLLSSGAGPKDKRPKMIPVARKRATCAPTPAPTPDPTPATRKPTTREPAPAPGPDSLRGEAKDVPKPKRGPGRPPKRARKSAPAEPAPNLPAKKAKRMASPDEPTKTPRSRIVPNKWERPKTRSRAAAEKPAI
ncbi:hypothetical protein N7486_007845 [Penicillium sp. IBT 16267x]|nr:hypothetical protein N7486_007845 [Penicillium sp. IBT 16267x]